MMMRRSTNMTKLNEGFSWSDLEIQRFGLEDRIKRLEVAIQAPFELEVSEYAGQLNNKMILARLLEVEKSNLQKVNFEIDKKKHGFAQ